MCPFQPTFHSVLWVLLSGVAWKTKFLFTKQHQTKQHVKDDLVLISPADGSRRYQSLGWVSSEGTRLELQSESSKDRSTTAREQARGNITSFHCHPSILRGTGRSLVGL